MTVAIASRPSLRVLPVPPIDPPYDDERDHASPPMVGSLALAFPPPTDALPLRLVPPALPGPQTTDPAATPDVKVWSGRLTQAIVEVFVGARAAAQLSPFTTLDVLHQLERWSGRLTTRDGRPALQPRVMSVHVCEPRDRIAEVCAVVDTGLRRRAFALRLEAGDGRWTCTALELG
jgi:hypothetical protein